MSVPISSEAGSSTLTSRFPRETSLVAWASFSMGTVMPRARWKPIQLAAKMIRMVMKTRIMR